LEGLKYEKSTENPKLHQKQNVIKMAVDDIMKKTIIKRNAFIGNVTFQSLWCALMTRNQSV